MTGAKAQLLKAAKRAGCKAFIGGGRVDGGILIPFLFEMLSKGNELPEGFASPVDWLNTEKARRESIRRKVDEKTMMPIAEAEAQASKACHFFIGELERGERELPPAMAGLSSIECFKRLHAFTESLRKKAKQMFEAIGK